MNKVEQVARAMCLTHETDEGWGDSESEKAAWVERGWHWWVPHARAAIEAMREPSEAMALTGDLAANHTGRVEDVFNAMITTALEEDRQTSANPTLEDT